MTNLGAHIIDQILWFMNVKGPTLVMSTGGRYALEDDGETPDIQDASWVFPRLHAQLTRFAKPMPSRGDTATRGQVYLGTKGTMILAGGYEVIPETKIDPVNDIPRFLGHPDRRSGLHRIRSPAAVDPGIQGRRRVGRPLRHRRRRHHGDERARLAGLHARPASGRCATWRTGTGWRSACNLANMSLRLGRAIQVGSREGSWSSATRKPRRHVRPAYRAPWDGVLRSIVKV